MNRARTGRGATNFAAQPPAAGGRIGERYQVIEQLGRGGSAVVYRVRDQSSPRELALKQLLPEAANNREQSALFEREFHTLAQLSHPSVIEVYDFGVDRGGPFYTMELLDGGDLNTRGPLDVRTCCGLISQVCSSLSLLHARRLVHRDVTARNVRCTQDGRAKLIDFGAVAAFGPCRHSVGTPAFTAPEVVYRLSLDARTDLFSLGVTLYFALTRRLPFNARSFADLHEAWRDEPSPPSAHARDVPAALDTLVLELLHVDPTRRPRSASEVMHRLAAIAGLPAIEAELSHYLGTPALVGRDVEQRRFRQRLRAAVHGQGSALWIESAPGVGRSRLLDACVLDAKTQGATVLHVGGSAIAPAPFETAHRLVEQLLEVLPQAALESATDAGALECLFSPGESPQLLPLQALRADRRTLQAVMRGWLTAMYERQPLMIAVDDAQRADEASLALLSALAHAAEQSPVILTLSAETPLQSGAAAVLNVLRGQCVVMPLSPLTHEQTRELLESVLGNVPHLTLLAERIHEVSGGNPREAMALAQHLVDRQLIRHAAGDWILPAQLTLNDLPADAESALRARIALLPADALALARAHALTRGAGLRRADYVLLAESAAGGVDGALAALVRHELLRMEREVYSLSHAALRARLVADLTPVEHVTLQVRLAEWCARSGRPLLEEVHHWLQAGHAVHGLERLRPLLQLDHFELLGRSGMDAADVAATLAAAFQAALAERRPRREIHDIAQKLTLLSMVGEDELHERYGPAWLAQLERDSGLADYRAGDPAQPSSQRMLRALQRTAARFSNTPEPERVYAPDEALRCLTRYATGSAVIATRRHDAALSAALPKLLEPFADMSPRQHALWEVAQLSYETTFAARPERARARAQQLSSTLDEIPDLEPSYRESIRSALQYTEGALDVVLGTASLRARLAHAEHDLSQQVLAGYLGRLVCIYAGDAEGAERCRKQTEVLAVQASARPMFDAPLRLELPAYVHAGDLDGVKQVADRMAEMARKAPGWRTQQLLASGCFERLRGDHAAAKAALEACLELANPNLPAPCFSSWVAAAAAYVGVLAELDLADEACRFGLAALEQCTALGIDARSHDLARELALAEAKLGEYGRAARRLDALIERRSEVHESRRAIDYEARARVAILARHPEAAAHYAALVTRAYAGIAGTAPALRHGRLQEEARRAGIQLSLPPTEFDEHVRSERPESVPPPTAATPVWLNEPTPAARAERALELLCNAARASSGQLYFVSSGQLRRVAARDMPADASLDQFAVGHFAQQLEDLALRSVITQMGGALGALESGSWTSPRGASYRIVLLKCLSGSAILHAGLCALRLDGPSALTAEAKELATALASQAIASGDAEPR